MTSLAYSLLKTRQIDSRNQLRKTSDNNDLNQIVASIGFSENKGLGGVLIQSRGLIKPGLDRSFLL